MEPLLKERTEEANIVIILALFKPYLPPQVPSPCAPRRICISQSPPRTYFQRDLPHIVSCILEHYVVGHAELYP